MTNDPKPLDAAVDVALASASGAVRAIALWSLGTVALGSTSMVSALVAGSSLVRLTVISVLGIGGATFVLLRAKRHFDRLVSGPPAVRFMAVLPVLVATLSFIAYSATLVTVHEHTVSVQQKEYVNALERLKAATRAANQTEQTAVDAAGPAVVALIRVIRLDRRQQQLLDPKLASVRSRISHDLKRDQDAAAFRLFADSLPVDSARKAVTYRALVKDIAAKQRAAQAEAAYRRAIPQKIPAADALPRWFSQLGRFFQLSAQLLAALTVALVFTRRGRWDPLSERHLALALVFAFMGTVAGLVGSLPDIHRGLQAVLLGYVVAGFGGVLTGLVSTSGAQQP